jgi:hypothetical protein
VRLSSAPACVSIRQHTPAYASIRQHTSAYVSIHQHTPADVSIRQRQTHHLLRAPEAAPPALRSEARAWSHRRRCMRQHTSAYVSSIRQHTSAHVSIRGDISILQHQRRCIRQHTSAGYVSRIRQRTSLYVSVLQRTSAYVSIRQHTSAYVSVRCVRGEGAVAPNPKGGLYWYPNTNSDAITSTKIQILTHLALRGNAQYMSAYRDI